MPYRDEFEVDEERRAALARTRAGHVREELASVTRLVEMLSASLSSTEAKVEHQRAGVAGAVDPFGAWWASTYNRGPLSSARRAPDADQIKRTRIELAEAQARAMLAAELVAIARDRVETLRRRVADDTASGTGDAHEVGDDGLRPAVEAACIRDASDLRDAARSMMATADETAGQAQRDAIRAALEGRDAEQEALGSTFVRALNELSRTRLYLELLRLSFVPVFGSGDPVVQRLTAIGREIGNMPDVPDEAWRRRISASREQLAATFADLDMRVPGG